MQPSSIRLRYDDPGRQMYQPRRILRLNRSVEPLHGYNGPIDPDHNHRTPPNAPPTQDRRVYYPMSRWSVSNSPNSTPTPMYHTDISNNLSNAQRNRHRSLAHHNPRPSIPLPHSKPRPNLFNRILQLGNRSKRRRGNSLRPIPKSHQQQVPPATSRQLA